MNGEWLNQLTSPVAQTNAKDDNASSRGGMNAATEIVMIATTMPTADPTTPASISDGGSRNATASMSATPQAPLHATI